MKNIVLIIIDGLGDSPVKGLKGETPLGSASTPNLDFMAEQGVCGLVMPYMFPGEKEPTSEGTHVALFGYKDYFLERGPYEALGVGFKLGQGDLALRANFATVDKNLKIIDRRAGRIKNTGSLIKALSGIEIKGVKFLIKPAGSHRAVLVLKGNGLSKKINDNDPHKQGVKVKRIVALDGSRKAKFTSGLLSQFLEQAHQILEKHPLNAKKKLPANYLLVRGAGMFKPVPTFEERYGFKTCSSFYWWLSSCCIAGGNLYKGIARSLGMKIINVKGATGSSNTDLKAKMLAVKKCLKRHDFIFLHIKATDTFGHDGDFLGKKKFIEKIDKNLKLLINLRNTLIVVTADHSSCCNTKDHCKELIPLLIYGKDKDEVNSFSEKACVKGSLRKIRQQHLMKRIFSFIE